MDDSDFGVALKNALAETTGAGSGDGALALLGAWLDHLLAIASSDAKNGMDRKGLAAVFGADILIDYASHGERKPLEGLKDAAAIVVVQIRVLAGLMAHKATIWDKASETNTTSVGDTPQEEQPEGQEQDEVQVIEQPVEEKKSEDDVVPALSEEDLDSAVNESPKQADADAASSKEEDTDAEEKKHEITQAPDVLGPEFGDTEDDITESTLEVRAHSDGCACALTHTQAQVRASTLFCACSHSTKPPTPTPTPTPIPKPHPTPNTRPQHIQVHTVDKGHDADREDEGEGDGERSQDPLTPSKASDISDIPEMTLETPKNSDVEDNTLNLSELPDATPAQDATFSPSDAGLAVMGAFQVIFFEASAYPTPRTHAHLYPHTAD